MPKIKKSLMDYVVQMTLKFPPVRPAQAAQPGNNTASMATESGSMINRKVKVGVGEGVRAGGFTLIEILVVMGIIAILATIVLVAVNPSKQFRTARDSQRTANIATILNAVSQNIADHAGVFNCNGASLALPTSWKNMTSSLDGFDVADCVVPEYISALPFDPSADSAHYESPDSYDTGYQIMADSLGRVSIKTPLAETNATGELVVTR